MFDFNPQKHLAPDTKRIIFQCQQQIHHGDKTKIISVNIMYIMLGYGKAFA